MLYNFAPSHILVALLPDGLDPKEWFYHPFLTVKKVGYSDLTLWKNEFFHFCKMQTSSKHQMEQLCLTHFVLNITSAHFAWIFNFFDLLGCRVVPVKNFCRKTCNSNAIFYGHYISGLCELASNFQPRVAPGLGEILKKHGFRGGFRTPSKRSVWGP